MIIRVKNIIAWEFKKLFYISSFFALFDKSIKNLFSISLLINVNQLSFNADFICFLNLRDLQ